MVEGIFFFNLFKVFISEVVSGTLEAGKRLVLLKSQHICGICTAVGRMLGIAVQMISISLQVS